MKKTTINATSEKEFKLYVSYLKRDGYKKIADAYWVEIWKNENDNEIILNREY